MATALLLTASFPPFEVPYAAWVALVPLLLLWERTDSMLASLAQAYSAYVLVFAFVFYWPVLNEFSNHGLWALVGLLLLPLVMATPFALSTPIRARYSRLHGFLLLFSGCLLVEAALLFSTWSFPWLLLGTTQAEVGPVVQLAEFGGVLGLTCWLWMVNGALFHALGSERSWITRGLAAALGVALVVGTYEAGTWRLETVAGPSDTVTAVLTQPNLSDEEWMDPYDAARVVDLMSLSEGAFHPGQPAPSLILWPEMALPVLGQPAQREMLYDRVQAWVNRHRTPLLTGALTANDGSNEWEENLRFRKSALFFRTDDDVRQHDQSYLLPITHADISWTYTKEMTPSERLRVLGDLDARPPSSFQIEHIGFGVLLDLEAWLGWHARRQTSDETGFLVILTRSGWWSNTPGFRSSLAHARIRAIESRRAVVQIANRGTSGIVLPDGTIDTEITTRGAWAVDIPVHRGTTLYMLLGDWPAVLAGLVLLLSGVRVLYIALGRK